MSQTTLRAPQCIELRLGHGHTPSSDDVAAAMLRYLVPGRSIRRPHGWRESRPLL